VAIGLVRLLRALGTSLPRRDLYTGTGIGIPRLDEVGIDTTALAFSVVVSFLTGVVFGLAPALRQARLDSVQRLRDGAGSPRARRVLVSAELAMAMMLLVGGGLLVHSFIGSRMSIRATTRRMSSGCRRSCRESARRRR
jgi:hypothetical protein